MTDREGRIGELRVVSSRIEFFDGDNWVETERVRVCSICRFWSPVAPHNRTYGECRRHPPVGGAPTYKDEGQPHWPITNANHWCGEFKEHDV